MKMIVRNLQPEQFSFELPLADGTVIRELIYGGCTIEITDIDPYDINTDKLLRQLVFAQGQLQVTFAPEPDDLIGLSTGITNVQEEGVDILGAPFSTLNFIGSTVTAAPGLPGVANITITSAPSTALELGDFREYIALSGTKNGSNLVYTIPDKAIHAPPGFQLKIYRNGVQQNPGSGNDYTVTESGGPTTGFDTITFAAGSAPLVWESLWAQYTLFGAGT